MSAELELQILVGIAEKTIMQLPPEMMITIRPSTEKRWHIGQPHWTIGIGEVE